MASSMGDLSGIDSMFLIASIVAAITIFAETTFGLKLRCLQTVYVVAFLSAVNHVCQNTFVHWGEQNMGLGPYLLFFVRCVFVAFFCTCFAKFRKDPIDLWPSDWGLRRKILARGVLGNIVILCLFSALEYIPAPFSSMVYVTKSIWASIMCWLFLHENLTLQDVFSMTFGLGAVFLLVYTQCQKSTGHGMTNPMLGFGLALAAALLGGVNSVQIRAMGVKVHYATNVFALASTGLLMCIFLAIAYPQQFKVLLQPTSSDLLLFSLVGVCSFMMQVTLNKAFAISKAGPLILFMGASTLVVQFLVDTGLGYRYGVWAWISAILICTYMVLHFWVLQAMKKQRDTKLDTSESSTDKVLQKTAACTSNQLAQYSHSLPSRITICGAGNIDHYLMCALTQYPQVSVTVFAPRKNYGSKLQDLWNGGVGLEMGGELGERFADMTRLRATEDPSEAFKNCDLVIFSMPSPAYSEYLPTVCRFAPNGTILFGLPGVGCFEWAVAHACDQVGRQLCDFKIVFTQDPPLSCRISEFGKKVFIRGKKVNGSLLGCVPPGGELAFCAWTEEMLLGQVNVQPAPALQCTMGTGCMVSHGFTLQSCLEELDKTGRDLDEGELLWYGREDRNSGMDEADREWRKLATEVLRSYQDKRAPPVVWELVSFLEMWHRWYPEVQHHDTLAASVANLSAYRWTTVPARNIEDGNVVRRVPNIADRKFSQDIPFSVCLVSLIGGRLGMPTPIYDANIQFMQNKMNKDYIRFEGSTKEPGEDLKSEAHFMPLLTGAIGIHEFLDFYRFQEEEVGTPTTDTTEDSEESGVDAQESGPSLV